MVGIAVSSQVPPVANATDVHRLGAVRKSSWVAGGSSVSKCRSTGIRYPPRSSKCGVASTAIAAQGKQYYSKNKEQKAIMDDVQRRLENGTAGLQSIDGSQLAASLAKGKMTLLDIRPGYEHSRGHVRDSVHVPLFVEDNPFEDVSSAVVNYIHLGVGGGGFDSSRLTILNQQFLPQVAEAAGGARDTPLLVACMDGRRSLLAIDRLQQAGYTKLAWLKGGFASLQPGQVPPCVGQSVELTGVGGLAALLRGVRKS
eukprot:jgi/Mesvir1/11178/Mv16997-RA.1